MIEFLPEPLQALAAKIEAVIYVADGGEARTPIVVGPSAEWVTGYTAEELCAEKSLYIEHVHPEDQERLRAELLAGIAAPYLPLKFRFIHKSGRVLWCRETQVRQPGGQVAGVTVDVTELELPQRALHAALAASDARGATQGICTAAAESFGLSWTIYLDLRTRQRLVTTYGYLGVPSESAWSEAPIEPWAREVHAAGKLDWIADGAALKLSPELQKICAGARFGFAVPLIPETEHHPSGVLIGLGLQPWESKLATYPRAVESLARQASVALHRTGLVDALRRTGRERQQLSDALLRAHEAERARLAHELHDGAGQTLTAVAIQLDLAETLATPTGRAPLIRARQQIERTLEELRRLSHALRPAALDDLGLGDALMEMAQAMQTAGFSVRVEAPPNLPPLPSEIATGLFRIAQAALTNVVRHAEAGRATLRLRLDAERDARRSNDNTPRHKGLLLEIEDDGRGLPAGASGDSGIGLIAMRERALALGGRFNVQNRAPAGRGALVEVWVPLP